MSYRTDKLVIDGHTDTHTHIHTQATTIPEGQNWPRVKTASRRSNTVMERQWRLPVAYSCNSTTRSICTALDGDSRRCQYAYLQSSTIDDARPRSMTDGFFTGARRRKFWTFQNFRTATAAIGAHWRSVAFTHGCVCALWRSTAFIHGFWTAAERRQKPPMCNCGLSTRASVVTVRSTHPCVSSCLFDRRKVRVALIHPTEHMP